MRRASYLLLKLAEEAGEAVVAAVKHRLHNSASTRSALSRELGDLFAVLDLLLDDGTVSVAEYEAAFAARRKKEKERAPAR